MSMPDIVSSRRIHTVSSSWAIATATAAAEHLEGRRADLGETARLSLCAQRRGRDGSSSAARTASEIDRARSARPPDPGKVAPAGATARGALAGRQISTSNSAGPVRSTPPSDGLPLIGPVPGAKGVYAAYGYGGNGITFSFLAAALIGDLIAGVDVAAAAAISRWTATAAWRCLKNGYGNGPRLG